MNSTLQSVIQSLLAAIGGFLVLKGIDAGIVGQGIGVAMGVASVIWGIVEKQANGSAIISVLTNVTTFVGGLLVASGKLSAASLQTIIGIVVSLASGILSAFHINVQTQVTTLKNTKK